MEKLTKKEKKGLRKEEKLEYQKKLDSQQRSKKLGIWAGVFGAIILSIFALVKLTDSSSTNPPQSSKLETVNSSDIQIGPKNAKVVLVEYADFQCPSCGAMHPLLKKLLAEDNSKILFVYRFFPLTQIHKNAFIAAQAAFAANAQGKFWEMHDMLYENQNSWADTDDPKPIFEDYAKKIGLNIDQFNKDIDSDSTKSFINEELNKGNLNAINHTPTLFLNGKEIEQEVSNYDSLKALVDAELRAK